MAAALRSWLVTPNKNAVGFIVFRAKPAAATAISTCNSIGVTSAGLVSQINSGLVKALTAVVVLRYAMLAVTSSWRS